MKKILIVEDDISIAELQRDYLEISEFVVKIEQNGKKGLNEALSVDYDLIILDIMLPEMNGFEIIKEIRAQKETPVLMVTAKKEDIDKIRGLGLGADDYITKPFSPNELVARVKSNIARYERLTGLNKKMGEFIQIRGLKIDQESRIISVNEKDIILTSKEYDILILLAMHPNKVFSKEEIFEKIWGLDSFGDITTVTVHIRKIREKIEKDPSKPEYIDTIWGVGYRLNL
ncbi:response regulator transcription factor [Clostridium sp. DL1XJH146]